jgi:hypothetical protein
MRAVNRLRSIRVRSYVLPLLLGALALRFLIPNGFMMAADGSAGTQLSSAMCSTAGKTENIEIPGEPARPHCDYCTLPSLDAPLSPLNIAGLIRIPQGSLPPQHQSQAPEAPLARAQTARAPPPRA